MATIPVSGVAASITAGSQMKTATSDASGNVRVTFSLTQTQYNALAKITAAGTKDAYERGEANLTSLPTFAVAKENGINMSVAMQLYKNANFYMSQSHVMFNTLGGTINVPVSCPDNTWTIYSFDERLTVSKSGSEVSITCPAGLNDATFDPVTIRWNDPFGGWQYRKCSVSAAEDLQAVAFRGRVVDGGTGTGVSGAAVVLGIYLPEPAIVWGEERVGFVDIAETRTDASGNYEIWQDMVTYLWDMFAPYGYTVRVSATAYNDASATISAANLPAFPNDAGVVLDFGTTSLVNTAASVFSVDITHLSFEVASTQIVTVTKAADDAFDFVFSDQASSSWVNITRTNVSDTEARLNISVAPYDSGGASLDQRVAQIIVYRTSAPSEGIPVTVRQSATDCGFYFSGYVKDTSTGLGIARAPYEIQVYDAITRMWKSFSPKAIGVTDETGAFSIRLSTVDENMNWNSLTGARVISSPVGYWEDKIEVMSGVLLTTNGSTGSLAFSDLLLAVDVPENAPLVVSATNIALDSDGATQTITVTKAAADEFAYEVDDPAATWLTVARTDISDTEAQLAVSATYCDNNGVVVMPNIKRYTRIIIYKTDAPDEKITVPVLQSGSDFGLYVTGYVKTSYNGNLIPVADARIVAQFNRTLVSGVEVTNNWITIPSENTVVTDDTGRFALRVSSVHDMFVSGGRYRLRALASAAGYIGASVVFAEALDWTYGEMKRFTAEDIILDTTFGGIENNG